MAQNEEPRRVSFFALDVANLPDEEIHELAVALAGFQDEQVVKSRRQSQTRTTDD